MVFGSIITTATSHKMSLSTKAELFFTLLIDSLHNRAVSVPVSVTSNVNRNSQYRRKQAVKLHNYDDLQAHRKGKVVWDNPLY